MKLTTTSKAILSAVNTVGQVIKSTTLPILDNVLFEVKAVSLKITADNLEVRSCQTIQVTSDADFSICIPFEMLSKILKGLPETPIDFTFTDNNLNISYPLGEYNMTTVPSIEFPLDIEFESEKSITVNSSELSQSLSKALMFIDETDDRPIGKLLIKVSEENTFVVGMSGYAGIEIKIDAKGEEADILLLKSSASYIKNSIVSDEEIKVSWTDKNIKIKGQDIDVSAILANGKYPNYAGVFPSEKENAYVIDHSQVMPSLKRISAISDKNHQRVGLTFSENNVQISHSNTDYGHDAKENVKIEYAGENMEIGFNSAHLRTAFSIFNDDATMYFSSPKKPCLLESENMRGIIAPMVK